MSDAMVFDTPESIEGYKLLAILHGLAMEINTMRRYGFPPTACPTRGRAFASAKRELVKAGMLEPDSRKQRVAVYHLFAKHLTNLGLVEE